MSWMRGSRKRHSAATTVDWPKSRPSTTLTISSVSTATSGRPPSPTTGPSRPKVARSLPHGHEAAVLGTIRDLGLEELVDAAGSRQRDLVTAMITAAVIDGSSKLATARGLRAKTAASSLGEVLGLGSCDEDDLYA